MTHHSPTLPYFFKRLSAVIALSFIGSAHAQLLNYGDPATASLVQALNQGNVHIMQIGDSHTAGDVMTDALRQNLQARLGNGGVGYAMPMWFSGQRMALISYDNRDFMPISSRTNSSESYTLGGMIARPKTTGATLTLKPKSSQTRQRFVVSIKQAPSDGGFVGIDAEGRRFNLQAPIKNNTWQLTQISATLPFTITADNTYDSSIGGWWGVNETSGGAVVSALGINGAQINYWNRPAVISMAKRIGKPTSAFDCFGIWHQRSPQWYRQRHHEQHLQSLDCRHPKSKPKQRDYDCDCT